MVVLTSFQKGVFKMEQNRLSIEEMFAKYPDQWLFIIDCEHDEVTQLVSGVVAVHSQSRDVINDFSSKYKGGAAIRWSGKLPEGVGYLL